MKNYLLIPATTLFILAAAPTFAAYDNFTYGFDGPAKRYYAPAKTYQVDNDVTPPPLVTFGVFAGIVMVVIAMVVSSNSSGSGHKLPAELQPKESAEHYDQQAARTRAYARKLDADASLAESQLRTSLKQDELKEFESFLRDKKSPRRK